jgi:hypothetical protein
MSWSNKNKCWRTKIWRSKKIWMDWRGQWGREMRKSRLWSYSWLIWRRILRSKKRRMKVLRKKWLIIERRQRRLVKIWNWLRRWRSIWYKTTIKDCWIWGCSITRTCIWSITSRCIMRISIVMLLCSKILLGIKSSSLKSLFSNYLKHILRLTL